MTSERLDRALVRRGLVRSRTRAAELIAAGHVRVRGEAALKPSLPVGPADELVVDGPDVDYVSRGGHKLAGALDLAERLDGSALPVAGARCLDVGASTGGFTEVLLGRGAAHVVAVDVGHGQLAQPIAEDPRVTSVEGLNVRDLTVSDLGPRPSVVVGDLSFISLTLVLPVLGEVVEQGGELFVLVKPQFEVGRTRLGNDGVVTSATARAEAVLAVATAAARRFVVHAVVPSPLPGPAGNHEYFLWLREPAGAPLPVDLTGRLEAAVAAAVHEDRACLVRPPHRGVPRRLA
ncbi:TlyA family RNA methyltransferase [Actinotalea sp.]|uniref:TlyA family RNA methyltransferase n=1 Tax=Actinotalea sp. TaxID=1872145 RepID=UPI003567377A